MSVLNTFLENGEVVPQVGNFNPHFDVPSTDEQVKYTLSLRKDNMADSMWGHYCCQRLQGMSLLHAWENVLLLSIGQPLKYTV
jgi:hypothetical protein